MAYFGVDVLDAEKPYLSDLKVRDVAVPRDVFRIAVAGWLERQWGCVLQPTPSILCHLEFRDRPHPRRGPSHLHQYETFFQLAGREDDPRVHQQNFF